MTIRVKKENQVSAIEARDAAIFTRNKNVISATERITRIFSLVKQKKSDKSVESVEREVCRFVRFLKK